MGGRGQETGLAKEVLKTLADKTLESIPKQHQAAELHRASWRHNAYCYLTQVPHCAIKSNLPPTRLAHLSEDSGDRQQYDPWQTLRLALRLLSTYTHVSTTWES